MENFIQERKSEFDFSAVSSRSKVVNANHLQVHILAYNLFNWFRQLVLYIFLFIFIKCRTFNLTELIRSVQRRIPRL